MMTFIGALMTTVVLYYYLLGQITSRRCHMIWGLTRQALWLGIGILTHALCLAKYDFQLSYFAYYVLTMILLTLAIIDGWKLEIPTDLLWVSGFIGILLLWASHTEKWYVNIIGAIATYGLMRLLFKVLRGGLGEGDVYIMVLLALYFGWVHALLVFLLALVISGLFGVVLLVSGKAQKKSVLPFVPFIAMVQLGLLLI